MRQSKKKKLYLREKKMECIHKKEKLTDLINDAKLLLIETLQSLGQSTCVIFDIDDTLISENSYPLVGVVDFLKFCKEKGCAIGLVTARHKSLRDITGDELKGVKIIKGEDYAPEDLFFCPQEYRTSYVKISQWKESARLFLRNKYKHVFCTVGDQWTDLIKIKDEDERKRLDEVYSSQITPYSLFLIHDGISKYGLKLKSDPTVKPKYLVKSSSFKPPKNVLTTTDIDKLFIKNI